MPLSRCGHAVEVQPDAEAALVAHLNRRTGEPRGAHVLDGNHRARAHELEARLQKPLLRERVAHLHRRALLLDGVVELGRGHRRPAHPVAPCLGAEVDDRHADSARGRVEDRVGVGQSCREGVHEAVAVVGGVEADLAAHGGDAEGVAVAADSLHDALHEVGGLGMRRIAEGERVHRRDGPRAHREDVAEDAAHARGRSLIGLDVGGVVVALHLEDHGLPVADVDDARVLARAADHLRARGVQRPEPLLRRLVGAVLVPHGREDAEFGERGRAPDDVEDALVLVGLEPVRGDQVPGDLGLGDLGCGHGGPLCLRGPHTTGRGAGKERGRRPKKRPSTKLGQSPTGRYAQRCVSTAAQRGI
jgi:hypothetical protein